MPSLQVQFISGVTSNGVC